MSFVAAVRSVLSQYVGFAGRARRSEYWWFFLFTVLVSIVTNVVDNVLGTTFGPQDAYGVVSTVIGLALLLPSLAVAVRRLHDTDRSGWWLLIALVPIVGAIVLIVFFAMAGTQGANRHGADPRGAVQPAPGLA